MLANAFIGRAKAPSHHDLEITLGTTQRLWRQLICELRSAGIVDSKEWGTYSTKAGWSLRLKRKDRIIVYLVPTIGGFTASVVLGDKALATLSNLSRSAQQMIEDAKRYPEGTALRIEVRTTDDLEFVKKLAAAKAAS